MAAFLARRCGAASARLPGRTSPYPAILLARTLHATAPRKYRWLLCRAPHVYLRHPPTHRPSTIVRGELPHVRRAWKWSPCTCETTIYRSQPSARRLRRGHHARCGFGHHWWNGPCHERSARGGIAADASTHLYTLLRAGQATT